jgi:hypothetical protein
VRGSRDGENPTVHLGYDNDSFIFGP